MLTNFMHVLWDTIFDVLPIICIIFIAQYAIIRRPMQHLKRVIIGFVLVLIGLVFFLVGLEQALFPIGEIMAKQLTDPELIKRTLGATSGSAGILHWSDYKWVFIFAAAIGFATTIAEPSLLAVAIKASSVSGGTISVWGLRIAVAIGVGLGISLGTYRIVVGTPLHYFIITGYVFVIIQTLFAPKAIIALAYDSGGVTTSTVTVPLVTALGIGLAGTVPGRSELIDGFGLIAFASLFPMITVMGYAQLEHYRAQRELRKQEKGEQDAL